MYARGFDAWATRLAEVWPGLMAVTHGSIRLNEILERHVDGVLYRAFSGAPYGVRERRARAGRRAIVEAFLLRPEAWGSSAPAVVREACPAAPVPETLRAIAEGCLEARRHLESLHEFARGRTRDQSVAACRDLETLAAGLRRRALDVQIAGGAA